MRRAPANKIWHVRASQTTSLLPRTDQTGSRRGVWGLARGPVLSVCDDDASEGIIGNQEVIRGPTPPRPLLVCRVRLRRQAHSMARGSRLWFYSEGWSSTFCLLTRALLLLLRIFFVSLGVLPTASGFGRGVSHTCLDERALWGRGWQGELQPAEHQHPYHRAGSSGRLAGLLAAAAASVQAFGKFVFLWGKCLKIELDLLRKPHLHSPLHYRAAPGADRILGTPMPPPWASRLRNL